MESYYLTDNPYQGYLLSYDNKTTAFVKEQLAKATNYKLSSVTGIALVHQQRTQARAAATVASSMAAAPESCFSTSTRDFCGGTSALLSDPRCQKELASLRALVEKASESMTAEADSKMPADAEADSKMPANAEADSKMPALPTRASSIAGAIDTDTAASLKTTTKTIANLGAPISTRDFCGGTSALLSDPRCQKELASLRALVEKASESMTAEADSKMPALPTRADYTTRPILAVGARKTTTANPNLAALDESTIGIDARKPIVAFASAGISSNSSASDRNKATKKTKATGGGSGGAGSRSTSSSPDLSMRALFGTGTSRTAPSKRGSSFTLPSSGSNAIGTSTAGKYFPKNTPTALKAVATAKAAATVGSSIGTDNTSKRKATTITSSAGVVTKKTKPLDSSSIV